jgi:2'-5' RNA ligase
MLMDNGDTTNIPSPTEPRRPVRVFVGIKIAPEIANELAHLVGGPERPSMVPVATADIHVTLVPPWDEACPREAVEKVRPVVDQFRAFSLVFRHLGYGPDPKRPRLLWARCMETDEIVALRAALLDAYGWRDERPFRPHVTLARIRGHGSAIARRCPIDRELAFTQHVESVEFFQSPARGARGYQVLASLRLGETQTNISTSA